jgi:hypothetical protein
MTDSWTPADAKIEVDLNSMRDFAEHIEKELNEFFMKNVTEGIRPMLQVAVAWGGGLQEGAFFRKMHDRNKVAAGKMLADAGKGLAALAFAAAAIAADYASGDDLSKATVDDVNNAFYPMDSNKSLNALRNQNSADGGKNTNPAASDDPTGTAGDPASGVDLHNHDNPGDTGALDAPTNADGSTTIDPNKPGQYVIPGDDEHVTTGVNPTPST